MGVGFFRRLPYVLQNVLCDRVGTHVGRDVGGDASGWSRWRGYPWGLPARRIGKRDGEVLKGKGNKGGGPKLRWRRCFLHDNDCHPSRSTLEVPWLRRRFGTTYPRVGPSNCLDTHFFLFLSFLFLFGWGSDRKEFDFLFDSLPHRRPPGGINSLLPTPGGPVSVQQTWPTREGAPRRIQEHEQERLRSLPDSPFFLSHPVPPGIDAGNEWAGPAAPATYSLSVSGTGTPRGRVSGRETTVVPLCFPHTWVENKGFSNVRLFSESPTLYCHVTVECQPGWSQLRPRGRSPHPARGGCAHDKT